MVTFVRNKETGKLEAVQNGKKVGEVTTMGDKILQNDSKVQK